MTDVILSISLHELCEHEELNEQIIVELVEHGIAEPIAGEDVADWVFDATSARWLQKAVRLHYSLEIDWVAVAMVIDLLQRNEALQRKSQSIEQQLKRFLEQN
jgi:chaperone modulatory protein CbpM